MITIEIQSADVFSKNIDTKEGKSLTIRNQNGYVHGLEGYPQRVVISLWDRDSYKPGHYTIDTRSFRVNRYGALELMRGLVLSPVEK